ncbi:MAG: hypothetical protein MI741_20400, partial [Rhodospirillales bacterium]|nr:hypothetical protein [Rhodospirillales bacterium]
ASASRSTTEAGTTDTEGSAAMQPEGSGPTTTAETAAPESGQGDPDLIARLKTLNTQQKVAEARAAEQEGYYALAVRRYDEALAGNPQDAEQIRRQRDAAAALAQAQPGSGPASPEVRDVSDETIRVRELRRQAAEAGFRASMNEARTALDRNDFPVANSAVERAKTNLQRQREYFPTEQYSSLIKEAEDLTDQIASTRQRIELQGLDEAERLRMLEQQVTRGEVEAAEDEKVRLLLEQAKELRDDMRFEEAREVMRQVLFIQPNNFAAQVLETVMTDDINHVRYRELLRTRDQEWAELQIDNLDASIPINEIIKYPSDWPELTERRLAGLDATGGESEANRRVRLKLREPIPNIDFDQNRLVNVIDFLRNYTGQNFIVFWQPLEAAGVTQDTPISLQLRNVPADQALDLILKQASPGDFDPIGYAIIDGIITISTERDLKRTVDTRIYDIKDLLVQAPNNNNPPQFDLASALDNEVGGQGGTGGGGGGGGGAGGGIFGQAQGGGQQQGPLEGVDREEAIAEILELIRDSVGDPLEWVERGGEISSIRELNGNLIIRTTPGNHREIIDLLTKLREERAIQISVEARFLVVQDSFLEEMAVDFDLAIDGLGSQWGPIEFANDTVELGGRGRTPITPSRFRNPDRIEQDEDGEPVNPGGGDGEVLPEAVTRSLTFGISYLNDLEVNLLVSATQANTRSLTLTAPRITFLNGNNAWITVARQVAFVSDLEPIPNAAGFDPTIDYVQEGVVLYVQGTVSADRRYVTLDIRPSLANIEEIR